MADTSKDSGLQGMLDLLERIAREPRLLESLSGADLARFKAAAGRIAHPNRTLRRKQRKAELRAYRAARVDKTEASRHETGIRELRRKPVFTTPNYFLPNASPEGAARGAPADPVPPAEVDESQHC